MQLHELKSNNRKKQKRIGRGGKRGTFSGRGTKGQKSRSGRRIRKAERDLIIRLPKRRGFRNKPKSVRPVALVLGDIIRKAKPVLNGQGPFVVDLNFLKQINLIPMKYSGPVKILDSGNEIKIPLILKGLLFSKSVKIKIEKAGGKTN